MLAIADRVAKSRGGKRPGGKRPGWQKSGVAKSRWQTAGWERAGWQKAGWQKSAHQLIRLQDFNAYTPSRQQNSLTGYKPPSSYFRFSIMGKTKANNKRKPDVSGDDQDSSSRAKRYAQM